MSSDLLWIKDRKLSGIFTTPSLVEGTMLQKSISKVYQVVNQATEFTISFTTFTQLTANGIIRFYLPAYGFYNPKTGSVQCTDLNNANSSITCTSVLFTDPT
jgi:hypothetical protein